MIALIITGGTVVVLSYITDSSGTIYLLRNSLSATGLAWVAKKVTEGINKDASQLIYLTGWSIAGVSVVKIIRNASHSVGEVAKFLDWVTFWN